MGETQEEREERIKHAKRAIQRREARHAGRKKTMSTEQRLSLTARILADRLALALHVMTHHSQFIEFETTSEWIKYLEDWAEELGLQEEKRPAPGHKWKHDFYRKQQRYTYFKNGIRAMLRRQLAELGANDEQAGQGENGSGARRTDVRSSADAGVADDVHADR